MIFEICDLLGVIQPIRQFAIRHSNQAFAEKAFAKLALAEPDKAPQVLIDRSIWFSSISENEWKAVEKAKEDLREEILKDIEIQVNDRLEEIFKDHPMYMGFCHTRWAEQKKIYQRDFGIRWKSPAEIASFILFD